MHVKSFFIIIIRADFKAGILIFLFSCHFVLFPHSHLVIRPVFELYQENIPVTAQFSLLYYVDIETEIRKLSALIVERIF